ncbi:MAG: hypothetical protein INR71_00070 [Terriglobus roseus]|nr:hypothetical protein [Terriglobus roseus]
MQRVTSIAEAQIEAGGWTRSAVWSILRGSAGQAGDVVAMVEAADRKVLRSGDGGGDGGDGGAKDHARCCAAGAPGRDE